MEFFTSGDWLHPVAIAFYTFQLLLLLLLGVMLRILRDRLLNSLKEGD